MWWKTWGRSLSVGVLLGAAGCPSAGTPPNAAGPATVIEGDRTPPLGDGFSPGPDLGEPPPPDPSTPGLAYLSAIAAKLQPAWATFLDDARLRLRPDHRLNEPSLETTLAITLDARGALERVAVAEASGVAELDAAAVEIARAGAPYPEPPATWISDDDRLHLRWRFARDRRQAGVAGASIERVELPTSEVVPRLLATGRIEMAARRVQRAAGEGEPALVPLLDAVAVAALEEAGRSDDPETASVAIEAAAAAGVRELVPTLRELARTAVAPAPRLAALRALGGLGDQASTDLLLAIVDGSAGQGDDEAAAAAAALSALGKEDLVAARATVDLESSDPRTRGRALAVLSRVAADDAVDAIAAVLARKGSEARDRRLAAAMALGPSSARSRKAARVLGDCLGTGDAALRAACARALAVGADRGLRSRAVYWQLAELFRHPDERVRGASVRAAARIDPGRFPREMDAVRTRDSALVAAALAEALTVVRGARASGRLAELARSDDAAVRRAAASSMVTRKSSPSVLGALLADPAPEVRAAAIGGIATAEAVLPHLADPVISVRVAALQRLASLRGREEIVGDAASRIAEAESEVRRALWAGAWLAPR